MKVFFILALVCAVAFAVEQKKEETRNGRYVILRSGDVYDTYYDYVIPYNAQYVVEKGAGANRDVYLKTVPFRSRQVYVSTY